MSPHMKSWASYWRLDIFATGKSFNANIVLIAKSFFGQTKKQLTINLCPRVPVTL